MVKFYKSLYLQLGVFCYHFLLTTSTLSTLFMFFGSIVFVFKYVFGIVFLPLKWWVVIALLGLFVLLQLVKFIKWFEKTITINL